MSNYPCSKFNQNPIPLRLGTSTKLGHNHLILAKVGPFRQTKNPAIEAGSWLELKVPNGQSLALDIDLGLSLANLG